MSNVAHIELLEETGSSLEERDSALDWSVPEFRTVITPRGRKGIRLERAFWRALSSIAEWLGVKRAKVISDVLEDADGQDLNSTSLLRSYAVHQLEDELSSLRVQSELAYAVPMMQHAPVPSFAVDRNKKLVRVNSEFNHYLRVLFAEIGEAPRAGLQINLEHPVVQVFDDIGRSGESREYMMSIVMGSRFRRVRTRLIAVPPHAPTALVGYIIP